MELSNGAENNFDASNGVLSDRLTMHITQRHLQIVEFVNVVFLSGLISIFGIVANIINIAVYYRQGLTTTMNISFFALAISDLSCLILQPWYIVITLCQFSDLPIVYTDFQHVTAAWPHETFTRLTCAITMYIAIERCISVVFPLTVRRIVTLKRTSAIILGIYTVHFMTWIPVYTSFHMDWKFFPERNRSLLGLIFIANEQTFTAIYISNAFFGVIYIATVVLATLILIRQFRKKTNWRESANLEQKKADILSKRDRTTVFMVIMIAIILIVCYTPSVTLCVIMFCYPGFSVGGNYFNMYQLLWSCTYVMENINSSVNIFLYVKMSSKYRRTLKCLCGQWMITPCYQRKMTAD